LWTSETPLPEGLALNASTGLIQGIPSVVQSGANITLRGLDLEQERVVEVTLVLLVGPDTDLDGMPDTDIDGAQGPLIADDDDDNDGFNDVFEQVCNTDPLNASSKPREGLLLLAGACVEPSGEVPTPEEDGDLFTYFLVFWVAVLLLFLLHQSREEKEDRDRRARQKEEEIDAIITGEGASEKEGGSSDP